VNNRIANMVIPFVLLFLLIITFPFGMPGVLTGALIIVYLLVKLYFLAKSKSYFSVSLVLILLSVMIYMLVRPYSHYRIGEYVNGKYVGIPHSHKLWESGHVR
jgi:hypothetical protein